MNTAEVIVSPHGRERVGEILSIRQRPGTEQIIIFYYCMINLIIVYPSDRGSIFNSETVWIEC